jgi:hypothetical protein
MDCQDPEVAEAARNCTVKVPEAQAGALYNATNGLAEALTTGVVPVTREATVNAAVFTVEEAALPNPSSALAVTVYDPSSMGVHEKVGVLLKSRTTAAAPLPALTLNW